MEEAKLTTYYHELKAGAPKGGRGGLGTGVDRARKAVESDLPKNALYANFVRAGAMLTDDTVAAEYAGKRETFAEKEEKGEREEEDDKASRKAAKRARKEAKRAKRAKSAEEEAEEAEEEEQVEEARTGSRATEEPIAADAVGFGEEEEAAAASDEDDGRTARKAAKKAAKKEKKEKKEKKSKKERS
jgi:hypothetical protein